MVRQTSKKGFFEPIYAKKLNVHPRIVSQFPYTCEWRFIGQFNSPVYGKTVDRIERGVVVTDYFVSAGNG